MQFHLKSILYFCALPNALLLSRTPQLRRPHLRLTQPCPQRPSKIRIRRRAARAIDRRQLALLQTADIAEDVGAVARVAPPAILARGQTRARLHATVVGARYEDGLADCRTLAAAVAVAGLDVDDAGGGLAAVG